MVGEKGATPNCTEKRKKRVDREMEYIYIYIHRGKEMCKRFGEDQETG